MTNNETLTAILAMNDEARSPKELIPVILAVIKAYHRNEIDLPEAQPRHLERRMWSPSVQLGRPKPRTHSRPFCEIQIGRLLGRLQNAGHGRQKADRAVVTAFGFLRQLESGKLSTEKFSEFADNLSGRDQLQLVRNLQ